ncbi:MAG TPA: hypothetical protein VIP53_05555 [Nitrososphaera sp.]
MARTSRLVVTATDLWMYSMIKFSCGRRPCGQSGQSGHVRP